MSKNITHLKSIAPLGILLGAFLVPLVTYAATLSTLLDGMSSVVITIIPILISLAVLIFFWGLVKFINHAGDEKNLKKESNS